MTGWPNYACKLSMPAQKLIMYQLSTHFILDLHGKQGNT